MAARWGVTTPKAVSGLPVVADMVRMIPISDFTKAQLRAAAEYLAAAEIQAELRAAAADPEPLEGTCMSRATYEACQDAIVNMMNRPVQPGPSFDEQKASNDSLLAEIKKPSGLIRHENKASTKDMEHKIGRHDRQIKEMQEFFSKNFEQ